MVKKRNLCAVSSSCFRLPAQAAKRPFQASTTSFSVALMVSAWIPAYWACRRAAVSWNCCTYIYMPNRAKLKLLKDSYFLKEFKGTAHNHINDGMVFKFYLKSAVIYLLSKGADVSLKCSMHAMERLCFAEILSQIFWKLILFLLDLHYQLFAIIKVPGKKYRL